MLWEAIGEKPIIQRETGKEASSKVTKSTEKQA
jgi:hypothetical protein